MNSYASGLLVPVYVIVFVLCVVSGCILTLCTADDLRSIFSISGNHCTNQGKGAFNCQTSNPYPLIFTLVINGTTTMQPSGGGVAVSSDPSDYPRGSYEPCDINTITVDQVSNTTIFTCTQQFWGCNYLPPGNWLYVTLLQIFKPVIPWYQGVSFASEGCLIEVTHQKKNDTHDEKESE